MELPAETKLTYCRAPCASDCFTLLPHRLTLTLRNVSRPFALLPPSLAGRHKDRAEPLLACPLKDPHLAIRNRAEDGQTLLGLAFTDERGARRYWSGGFNKTLVSMGGEEVSKNRIRKYSVLG